MNSGIIKWAVAAVGAAGLAGCATVPRGAGFGVVQDLVADRTGHFVQWRGNTADDAAVDASVGSLLAGELTVDQAVQVALLNNRHLQARFEDLGIAQADLVQAGLLKNPVFSGSWRFPDRSPSGTNAEYSVAQDFLDVFILPLRRKIAQQQFQSTRLLVAGEVLQLAADVKSACYTLQARQQLLAQLNLIVEINQTAAELAQRQHDAGTLNDLGLVGQQTVYNQSKVDLAQAQAQLAVDRERLNRLLGLWGNRTAWKLADHLPDIPAQEIPVEHLESLAMRQRLDLAAARSQVVAFDQALAATRGFRYVASAEIGLDTEREPDGQNITGPTLSLQIPLFDQGQAQLARAESQLRQLQRRYEALAIDARSEVREARDRMLARRRLAEAYKVLLPERARILNLTLQHYNGMLKGPYDLLLARQNQAATEQAYIEAWRDYWIARAELERALGGRLPGQSAAPASRTSASSRPATMPGGMHMPAGSPHDMQHMNGAQP